MKLWKPCIILAMSCLMFAGCSGNDDNNTEQDPTCPEGQNCDTPACPEGQNCDTPACPEGQNCDTPACPEGQNCDTPACPEGQNCDTPSLSVSWCQIHWPQENIEMLDSDKADVYGRVFVNGCTNTESKCADKLKAQLGYGAKDETDASKFTYINATTKNDAPELGNNAEYVSTLQAMSVGEYNLAYRFGFDGENWVYCDRDNYTEGYNKDNTIGVKVSPSPVPTISWCQIHWPESDIEMYETGSVDVFGRVFVGGCTDSETKCEESIFAELGYGPKDETDASKFTYYDAVFNHDAKNVGNNAEYKSTLTAMDYGEYNLAYRFSLDKGQTWVYCDRDNYTEGFDKNNTIGLKVTAESEKTISWCQIHWPQEDFEIVETGTADVYGRVFVDGCTNTESKCADILYAQLGYGAKDETDASKFTYIDATPKNDAPELGQNAEYTSTLESMSVGEYNLAYRFSMDGENWVYCDRDNYTEGYDKDNTIEIKVTKAPEQTISWCQMFLPNNATSLTLKSGKESPVIFGQALVKGCTEADGACKALKAYVGYGKSDKDLTTFTLKEAEFDKQVNQNDQYKTTLTIDNDTDSDETYELAYGFKLNDGDMKWCTLKDSKSFNRDDLAKVTVETSKLKVNWCKTYMENNQTQVIVKSGEKTTINGEVFVKNCTDQQEQCKHVKGHLAYGPVGKDFKDYEVVDAILKDDAGNNEKYFATITSSNEGQTPVTYNAVMGFSIDDGDITWCDTEGNTDFDSTKIVQLGVNPKNYFLSWGSEPNQYSCGIDSIFSKNNSDYHNGKFESNAGEDYDVYGSIYIKDCTNTQKCKYIKSASLAYFIGTPTNFELGNKSWYTLPAKYFEVTDNNMNYKATVNFKEAGEYHFYYQFGLEDTEKAVSQTVQCFVNWVSPYEATVEDLGVATIK